MSYESLVNDPIDCLKSLEETFDLNIINNNEKKILNFIDPNLKHF